MLKIAIFLIAVLLFAFFKSKKSRLKGMVGEKIIDNVLSLLPNKYIVINDVLLKYSGRTTQIDHIVVSPHGVFVIETKNYKGWIYGSAHAGTWTQNIYGKKFSLYNPILQNEQHIRFLINKFPELLRIYPHIKSVVVFLRAGKLRVSGEGSETVIRPHNLLGYIKSFVGDVMSYGECEEIAAEIKRENIDDKKERRAHKLRVRQRAILSEERIKEGLCPVCGGRLIRRSGRYGDFYGCSNYPRCKYTQKG